MTNFPSNDGPTQAQFQDFADHFLRKQVWDKLVAKADIYNQREEPALENLQVGAALLGLRVPHYTVSLATKQWFVLCRWAAGRRQNVPLSDITGRIIDLIVYLLLLAFWISVNHGGEHEHLPHASD